MSFSALSPKTSARKIIFSKIFDAVVLPRVLVIGGSFHQREFGSLKKPKALHRITDERLCSTEGSVALTERGATLIQEILRERP
jgi:hypothetical protein